MKNLNRAIEGGRNGMSIRKTTIQYEVKGQLCMIM